MHLLRKLGKILLIFLGIVLVAALLVPLVWPVPPLQDVQPTRELAGPNGRFLTVNGIELHYEQAGAGEPTFLLLHGFLSSTYSWREVTPTLAERGAVIAYDRPAFGLSARPTEWDGPNPYAPAAQTGYLDGLLASLGVEKAILVGNSAGGAVALQYALAHPERVQALILVDAAVYSGAPTSPLLKAILRTPQARRIGPLLIRNVRQWGRDFGASAWHDPSKITPEVWEGYTLPLRAEDWDKALYEFTLAAEPTGLEDRLGEIQIPSLVITGDDDRIVPPEQAERLARELPNARLVVIPECGHIPHEECPQEFLAAVFAFLEEIQ